MFNGEGFKCTIGSRCTEILAHGYYALCIKRAPHDKLVIKSPRVHISQHEKCRHQNK